MVDEEPGARETEEESAVVAPTTRPHHELQLPAPPAQPKHPNIFMATPGQYDFTSVVHSVFDMTPEAAAAYKEAARCQFAIPSEEKTKQVVAQEAHTTKRHTITTLQGGLLFIAVLLAAIFGLKGDARQYIVAALVVGGGLKTLLPSFRKNEKKDKNSSAAADGGTGHEKDEDR